MKYLGIYLTPKLTSLFRTNFIPLLNTIRSDLQKWTQLAHSWLGRISVIKMNVLPRLLFMLQMIPLGIPAGFFTLISTLISKYVWNRRRPRLARVLLVRSKCQGGLALPNVKQYFLAIILNRISDWKYHKDSKIWVHLEMSLSQSNLSTQVWIPKKYRSLAATTSPLTYSTLMVWDYLSKLHKWQYNSPLMPLTGHDYFPPGNMEPRSFSWNMGNTPLLHQVTTPMGIVPLSTLSPNTLATPLEHWKYRQLKAFVDSLPKLFRTTSELTPIEGAFLDDQPVVKPIFHFYQALQSLSPTGHPSFLANWEKDLRKEISEAQRSTILLMAHTSATASKTAEVNYKLLTRWHYTPAVLHKTFPLSSPLCWRGCGEKATHAHVLWFCPYIRPYWLTILYWIKEIQGFEIPNDPLVVLLHCTGSPAGAYKKINNATFT